MSHVKLRLFDLLTRYSVRNLAYMCTNIFYVAGTVLCLEISDLMLT